MKSNKRLLWSWIIALGLIGFGVLANWYMIYVVAAQPLTECDKSHRYCSSRIYATNPYQNLYEDLLYPSVRITTNEGIGSGVILSNELINSSTNELFILTAGHVVGNEALVSVELFGSAESLPAFVVTTDTGKDLALLQLVLTNNQQLKTNICPTRLAPRDYVPYIFTPIWVVGCSLGYAPRPTEGTITALSDLRDSVVNYWEMNAPIWPGNSGGGVFLKDTHELIGIAVWVKICHGQLASTMGGIVPLQTIYEFLESVKSPYPPFAKGEQGGLER